FDENTAVQALASSVMMARELQVFSALFVDRAAALRITAMNTNKLCSKA
ncbi:MAG: hypothetical protein K0R10_2706, partial [Alphaproteobacteria bacterium]|nr:hypothetical protein [Alphaproteobacteria bacterium]